MSSLMTGLYGLVAGLLLFAGCSATPPVATSPVATSPATSSTTGTTAATTDAAELERLQAIARRVEIIRDDFGVPHIYGKSDADAVFGLLYAQAEDDFARVERNYIWAIGRLAEVEGESALYSDLRARLYMSLGEAKAAYAKAPPWLQTLCEAFADGLNYYLATHPEVTPALIQRFEPWMPMYFFEGSIGGDIEQIPLPGLREFYSNSPKVAALSAESGAARLAPAMTPERASATADVMSTVRFSEPLGSNGFAIAPARSRSGNALLLINPHTSFFFRGEVHVVSEEGLNAYGAVTWGQFFVYQGFNADTGWMHTSTNADFIDDFVEQVVRDRGALKYRFGRELRDVLEAEVALKVRNADGGFSTRAFTGYRTHHGPITHALDSRWVSTRINWDPVTALQQSWERMKQPDYAGFRRMMDLRTNSSNNTVFADSSGNIGYFHGNFMPRRDPAFDYSKPVDGANPATDWQGLHSVADTVNLLNPETGWLQNCNSTPFTAAAEASPKRADYPAYMAPDAENHRGVHAVRVLRDARDVTLEGLLALAYDPQLPGFEKLLAGLQDAVHPAAGNSTGPRVFADWRIPKALALLADWDLRTSAESTAMTIAHFYGLNMLEGVETPNDLSRMQRIDWLGTSSPPAQRLRMLSATLDELAAKFGRWQVPWADVNRYQRLDGAISPRFDDAAPSTPIGLASGNWGALASFGAPRRDDVDKLYGRYGNSFVAAVEFGDKVRAKTLLAGGQSGDPRSPHFADQVERYANSDFKEVAYYRADVERRAREKYAPGYRSAVPE